MRDLHWLKIPERIVYKLCLLVYKCCNNLAPKYLTELLPSRTSRRSLRSLRSSRSVNITEAYFKNSQCHSSSFSSAGPRAWNSLPTRVKTDQSLNSFKSLHKTYLFTIPITRIPFKSNFNLILILLSLLNLLYLTFFLLSFYSFYNFIILQPM